MHPSTLDLLDELGLGERFAALPTAGRPGSVTFDGGTYRVGRLHAACPAPHPYIVFVPQWDFLDLLADEAGR